MLQLQPDDRTFKKVIDVLIETDDFYDSSDDGPDDEEDGVLCQWRGMLGNIPRPIDTQTQFIHGDHVCLVSEDGWYLIVGSKAPNGRYDVDLCLGEPHRIWVIFHQMQASLLKSSPNDTHVGKEADHPF